MISKRRLNKLLTKLHLLVLILVGVSVLSGCNFSDMPFNGQISFHSISLHVPEKYIRDSTQSEDDFWLFENGNYSKYIMISRSDLVGDLDVELNEYVDYLREQGADSERTIFLEREAVRSSFEQDGQMWQEILFAYDDSLYAVGLRGGNEADFNEIIETIKLDEMISEL